MELKTYRRASAAYAAAGNDRPIIRIGDVYLVPTGDDATVSKMGLVECEVIAPVTRAGARTTQREILGHVSMKHLARLGNANWAKADEVHQPLQVAPKRHLWNAED